MVKPCNILVKEKLVELQDESEKKVKDFIRDKLGI